MNCVTKAHIHGSEQFRETTQIKFPFVSHTSNLYKYNHAGERLEKGGPRLRVSNASLQNLNNN